MKLGVQAPCYRLYALSEPFTTPAKPGMIRTLSGGDTVSVTAERLCLCPVCIIASMFATRSHYDASSPDHVGLSDLHASVGEIAQVALEVFDLPLENVGAFISKVHAFFVLQGCCCAPVTLVTGTALNYCELSAVCFKPTVHSTQHLSRG